MEYLAPELGATQLLAAQHPGGGNSVIESLRRTFPEHTFSVIVDPRTSVEHVIARERGTGLRTAIFRLPLI